MTGFRFQLRVDRDRKGKSLVAGDFVEDGGTVNAVVAGPQAPGLMRPPEQGKLRGKALVRHVFIEGKGLIPIGRFLVVRIGNRASVGLCKRTELVFLVVGIPILAVNVFTAKAAAEKEIPLEFVLAKKIHASAKTFQIGP